MFRMLQAVEYEPQEDLLQDRQTDASMIIKSPRPAVPANTVTVSYTTGSCLVTWQQFLGFLVM